MSKKLIFSLLNIFFFLTTYAQPVTIDNSYFYAVGFNMTVRSIALQNDGKAIVGGSFISYDNFSSNRIIRLNLDGTIDLSFNIGTGFDQPVSEIAIQDDGKILVGGYFLEYNGAMKRGIVRLNQNGSIDNSFNMFQGFNSSVRTIAIQDDGKILVGGSFTEYIGVVNNRIIRLNTDGSIDNSFNVGDGFPWSGDVTSITIQNDGKILVGGNFTNFDHDGITTNRIIRLNADGTRDNSFITGSGFGNSFNDYVSSIVQQIDGKILIGGDFGSYNGTVRNKIIRLNLDGSIDNSFDIGTGFDGWVHDIILQSGGGILAGGQFTSYNGTLRNYLIRLNTDGNIDNSFDINQGFNSSILTMMEQSDGRILVGGSFTSYNGTSRNRIIRLLNCFPSQSTDIISGACDSYSWIDGNTYTSSNNTATHTIVGGAASGCDSVVTLNLTLGQSNTGMDIINSCTPYTWIDGNTYTISNNTATHTLTNISGCDSVVTLDLTIGSNTGVDVLTECNSYTWIDGNTYTSSNNTATHTLTNAAGCDSVVTLDLTIYNSTTGVDVQTACNSYTWIDGNTYTASNNTATHTLANAAGCDSLVTLNLTINSSTTGTDVISACDSYAWIDGNTYTSSNNTATHTLTNTAGCDSVVTLDLTVNYSTTGTDVITACDSYTWIDGNTYTSSNNTATHTLTNSVGCDSVVTLDLTINTVNASVSQNNTTLTANATGANYQWIDCDNGNSPISGETNQSFTATVNGNYAVEVTQNGCTQTSECLNVNTVGINENDKKVFVVYPNPSEGVFTIKNTIKDNTTFTITDITGKVVKIGWLNYGENIVDLAKNANGVYLLNIEDQTIKLVKK